MKGNRKNVEGITLVALVVTIIVLLILAGIAINLTVGNNGLFSRAMDARNIWKKAELNEQQEMSNFEDIYDEIINNTIKKNIDEIDGNEKNNIITKDKNGNRIIVPAGFKPVNPEDDVTQGIIIEDITAGDETSKGNQYVWIPVTTVNGEKTSTIKDSKGQEHEVELARYSFNRDGSIESKTIDGRGIEITIWKLYGF